jgi:acetylornithine deacetylase/succinyl-diaminopimelate desuccinylase-like protein
MAGPVRGRTVSGSAHTGSAHTGPAHAGHVLADGIDWSAAGDQAIEWLRRYVAFRTVNDPEGGGAGAGEQAACEWLAGLLRAEGIECEVLQSAPGRANLVASTTSGDPSSSVTLLSHSDVVPAVEDDWEVPPFDGQIRDGYLYGRGVLDLKGLGIAQLMTLIQLQKSGVPLRRQVRVLVVADEESGGQAGAGWLLDARPELLDTAVVLGEGAYSVTGVMPDDQPLQTIAVGEKGCLELELSVTGTAEHASMPSADSAPARLVRALDRIMRQRSGARVTDATAVLCERLSDAATGLHRFILRRPKLVERIGAHGLHLNPIVAAMLTETVALTVLESGYKNNVVPGHARAVLDIRVLPGTDPDTLEQRISQAAADPGIKIRRLIYKPPTSSPFPGGDYANLDRSLARDGLVAPIISPGASDNRFWRAAGVPAYGWVPFVIPVGDIHGVHGANERVAVTSFRDGIRQYYQAIAELAGAGE